MVKNAPLRRFVIQERIDAAQPGIPGACRCIQLIPHPHAAARMRLRLCALWLWLWLWLKLRLAAPAPVRLCAWLSAPCLRVRSCGMCPRLRVRECSGECPCLCVCSCGLCPVSDERCLRLLALVCACLRLPAGLCLRLTGGL